MIEQSDRTYLIDLLVELLAGQGAPREAVCIAINDPAFAAALPLTPQPSTLLTKAVDLCISAGRNNVPPWLERLITNPILGVHVGSERLQKIQAQIVVWPVPQDVPTARQATLLGRTIPFVNRTQLRRALVHLETDAARQQPILVVNGSRSTGKSYTRWYIEHFVFTRAVVPRIVAHHFEFKSDQALALGPVHLAKELVSSLGRDTATVPDPDTNLKLYVGQLAGWVLNEAVRSGYANWFVLDGFRVDDSVPESSRPRPDTMDFLIALSDKITGGTYVDRCRLILTGFNRALLTVDPGKLDEEVLRPCTRAEAVACIREALTLGLGAIQSDKLEALIADELPADPARMPELNARLRLLLNAISEVRAILPEAQEPEIVEWLFEMLKDLPPHDRMGELKRRLAALEAEAAGSM